MADLALPKTGLIRGRRVDDTLKSIIGDAKFGDLRIPLACVATDIDSDEEVVLKQGLVWKGVRASGSIPVILAVAKWGDRYLVDGGIVNPVPVSVVPHNSVREAKEPNIFSVIMQTIHISGYQAVKSSLSGADIVIEPQVGHIAPTDFLRVKKCVLQGKLAAQNLIPEIKRRLG